MAAIESTRIIALQATTPRINLVPILASTPISGGGTIGSIQTTASSALTTATAAESAAGTAQTTADSKLSKGTEDTLTGAVSVATTGGVKAGTVTWDSFGNVTGGTGVSLTAKGIKAVQGGTTTFELDAVTGAATFAGNVFTSGYIVATGRSYSTVLGEYATIVSMPANSADNAIVGHATGTGKIGVYGRNNLGYGVVGVSDSSIGVAAGGYSSSAVGLYAENNANGYAIHVSGKIRLEGTGATTGSQTPNSLPTKPGTTGGTGLWLPVYVSGTRYWIPMWTD